ncbi:MAG TPA: VOC family protein [Phycisphaerales bacterium]|nr:VOC family protein [Phycisphaerales bacterium]HRQ74706.1 VOC family protein [Phycisphaerales bacterium]
MGDRDQQATPATPESKPHYDKVTTFLMFQKGDAEEAITFYISLFDDAGITRIERYGPDDAGPEGKVLHAAFTLAGRPFIAFDSPQPHTFDFTPAISLFVTSRTEAEFDRLYEALSEGGRVMMPPNDYGFSPRFAFLNDRFGVSWQINLGKIAFDRDSARE